MPTLLEPGNILNPKGHEKDVPLEFIMDFFKSRVRGLGGAIRKAHDMSDRIMILRAETGAGKSTTIPPELYIRFKNMVHVKNKLIVCTQPTRLNTTEIPQDIIKIYGHEFKMGENLGYQTGPISYKVSRGVLYMTVETLVEQLKSMTDDEFMERYAFIIIDEAHHRDLPTDVVMSMMKGLLKRNIHKDNCPFMVIMSATLDVNHFAKFMDTKTIIEISGKPYTITANFLETDAEKVLPRIVQTVKEIHKTQIQDFDEKIRDILVFVPGTVEISYIIAELENIKDLMAIPLYRENFIRGTTEFWNIFEPIERLNVKRRVIISTSIAETGVTIETVKYVVDSGWARVSEFYPPFGINCLITKPASQSSVIQRRGRCGRKGPGVWYPMYTEDVFNKMQPIEHPDIIRGEATPALLDLFHKNGIDLENIEFLDTPSSDSLTYSMEQMYVLGSINRTQITELGEIMASMRLKLPYIRMILAGYFYNVNIVDLITIATGLLSSRDIIGDNKLYTSTLGSKFLKQLPIKFKSKTIDKAYDKSRYAIADEFIEFVFILNAFVTKLIDTENDVKKMRVWCESIGLNYVGIMIWISTRDELIFKMKELGFNVFQNVPVLGSTSEKEFIESIRNIKRCIYEGFKLQIATWNESTKMYVSDRHKFKVKSWSPLLGDGYCPNYIIFDSTFMSYNSKSKSYSVSVSRISVMDGWISQEYDTRFTAPTTTYLSKPPTLNKDNIWEYKKITTTKLTNDNPLVVSKDIEKTYDEELLRYSAVVGGWVKAIKWGGYKEPQKIWVF